MPARPRLVAALLAAACGAAVALVLAPAPLGVRTAVALPIALVVPGLALARLAGIRSASGQLALAFPLSGALWVALAQALLYLHAWKPQRGYVGLLLATALVLLWELRGRREAEGSASG